MIVEVWNLMWQWAQLFYRLEAVETLKAYISHNMDDNEELCARLETVKGEATVARKLAGERVGLMRKVEKEKEAAEAEAHRLAERGRWCRLERRKLKRRLDCWGRSCRSFRRGSPFKRKSWRWSTRNKWTTCSFMTINVVWRTMALPKTLLAFLQTMKMK